MESFLSEQEEIDRDLDLWETERQWRKQLPRLEEAQWLHIFPQAEKKYGKIIRGKLKIEKKYLLARQTSLKQETNQKISDNTFGQWRDEIIQEFYEMESRRIQKRIRTIDALLDLIRPIRNIASSTITPKVIITPEMIQRARQYPLERLVEIKKGFTQCFAHDDKTPSAYCKGNFIHCFVCNKSWDTIAVLQQRDGLGFKESVLKLQ